MNAMTLGWLDVGALTDIPLRGGRVVRTPRGCIAVFRAFDDTRLRPRRPLPPQGRAALATASSTATAVTCPLHGLVISLATGDAATRRRRPRPHPRRPRRGRPHPPRPGGAPAMTGAVRTTCPYCGVGCGILATPDGRGGVAIAGDPDHPANFGRLCSKGSALGQTVSLDGRLLTPAHPRPRRRLGRGPRPRSPAASAATAPRAGCVAIYGSGQLLTEDYYVANKLMKGFIGAANIDTNSPPLHGLRRRRPPPRLRRRHRPRHLRGPRGGRPRRPRRLQPRLVPPGPATSASPPPRPRGRR